MIDVRFQAGFKKVNEQLREESNKQRSVVERRDYLSKLGKFLHINANKDNYQFLKGKGVVAVDGSFKSLGERMPYMIFAINALAFNSQGGIPSREVEVSSGLDCEAHDEIEYEKFTQEQRRKMAKKEVIVATQQLNLGAGLTMFDGGFWRFEKEAEVEWAFFKQETLNKNVPCVGVIEDIGSYDIYELVNHHCEMSEPLPFMMDVDYMNGVLDVGEVFMITVPYRSNYRRCYARFSTDPKPVAFEFLKEHDEYVVSILELAKSLTNQNGRGIPILIDIVDKKVKITNEQMDMLSGMIDKDHIHKYFTPKRSLR